MGEAMFLGVVLEISATVFGTFGKQLVSYSGKLTGQRACVFKVVGLVATTLFGPILDASAYAYAPQAVVAPLNGLDLVWNTCSAPFTLGEKLHRAHIIGTLLVFLGSVLSTVFIPSKDDNVTYEELKSIFFSLNFMVYLGIAVGLLTMNYILLRRREIDDPIRGVQLAAQAGCIAGQMFFLSQALGLLKYSMSTCIGAQGDSVVADGGCDLEDRDWSPWHHVLPNLVSVSAIGVAVSNIPFMTQALEHRCIVSHSRVCWLPNCNRLPVG